MRRGRAGAEEKPAGRAAGDVAKTGRAGGSAAPILPATESGEAHARAGNASAERGRARAIAAAHPLLNIAMVDPSLFTIPYDCELAHALAGIDASGGAADRQVILYGRPLRPGEALWRPIRLVTQFHRASERLPGAVRRAAKGIEHAFDLARFARRMSLARPDVIHFQWCPLPVFDRAAVKVLRRLAPMVLTVHDPKPYNGGNHGMMTRGARELPRLFDAVIVHSEHGKAQLVRDGIDPARLHVVPHGPLEQASRRTARPSGDKFTIVFFGKIKPYKGLDTLIAALGGLPPGLKAKAQLIVVGEPAMDMGDLRAAAAAAEVPVRWELRFIDNDEIDDWLGQSDLFVFPYREIDASGVFMSCLKYGKPVVATRIGMFAEVLQHGVHGYLLEPDRPAPALTTAIAALMGDPALADRMGAAVGRLTDSLPSWPDIGRSTMGIYAEARDRWRRDDR